MDLTVSAGVDAGATRADNRGDMNGPGAFICGARDASASHQTQGRSQQSRHTCFVRRLHVFSVRGVVCHGKNRIGRHGSRDGDACGDLDSCRSVQANHWYRCRPFRPLARNQSAGPLRGTVFLRHFGLLLGTEDRSRRGHHGHVDRNGATNHHDLRRLECHLSRSRRRGAVREQFSRSGARARLHPRRETHVLAPAGARPVDGPLRRHAGASVVPRSTRLVHVYRRLAPRARTHEDADRPGRVPLHHWDPGEGLLRHACGHRVAVQYAQRPVFRSAAVRDRIPDRVPPLGGL